MALSLFKRKKESDHQTDVMPKMFKPVGKVSCAKAILNVWKEVPIVFSLRYISAAVRNETGVDFMDTTVSSALRKLRRQRKIDYFMENTLLFYYRKVA